MIYSQQWSCIVDYLGTHEHLAVDINLSVDDRGGLCLRSGEQRFYEGVVGFRLPMAFSVIADVCEWFDDSDQMLHISVSVHHDVGGRLFGYTRSFTTEGVSQTDRQITA